MKKNLLSILFGALLLLSSAFKNQFPFLYADSGTYLQGGFEGIVSPLRPITYGLFLRHVSLLESLWLVVFVQAWLVSWQIHLFYRVFSKEYAHWKPLLSILLLILFTTISISTGMLMPDFITPLIALSLLNFVFGNNISKLNRGLCLLLILFALLCHHSHFYILLASTMGYFLLLPFLKNWRRDRKTNLKMALMFPLLFLAYFGLTYLHHSYNGKWERQNASHVFLLNRFNRTGLLNTFLKEKCASTNYPLCSYIDKIPYEFLWDPNSPANIDHKGWESKSEEYNQIIRDFFFDWKYARKFAIATAETTLAQFFCFEGKLVFPEKENGAAFTTMSVVWPEQLNQLKSALQYWDLWEYESQDRYQRFLVFGSLFFLLFLFIFSNQKVDKKLAQIAVFLLIFLLANALICGGISMIDPRFQARVVWLIPLLAFFILFNKNIEHWKSYFS